MRTIRPADLAKQAAKAAKSGQGTMIWGAPGIGKSEIVYQLGDQFNAKVFEIRANLFDPVDVRGGLKVVEQQDGTYRTKYGVPEDYPDANYPGTVLLFIDDLTHAPKATQNALLQLLLCKRIGTYELPPNTIIIAAGNRSFDRAGAVEMTTAVKSRFRHYVMDPHIDDFCAHAHKISMDPSIPAFLRYRPNLLHDIDTQDYAFPTPRTWSFVNEALPFIDDDGFYDIASCVGDGAAGEYLSFRKIYHDLPDIDQILRSPGSVRVPDSPSTLYAVAGALSARANQQDIKSIMTYLRRLPTEYQVVAVKDILGKDQTLATEQAVQQYITDNASVIF